MSETHSVEASLEMRRRQTGLSLIELMVALTIGLLLLLGVTNIVINSSRAHKEISAMGQQLENGRYAMETLTKELKHAGFYGQLFEAIPQFSDTSLPDPCVDAGDDPSDLEGHLELAVQGYDGANGLACLPDENYLAGTDILVIRRAETGTTTSLEPGEIYLQALPRDRIIAAGDDPGDFTLKNPDGSDAEIRKFRIDIYYVSPCSVYEPSATACTANADGGQPIPTLKRLTLTQNGGTTLMRNEALVEGIENLQIDWGIDRNGDGAPNESDPGVSGDDYVAEPSTVDEWKNVVVVRLHVLARNIDSTVGYVDNKRYSFGESGTKVYGGSFKRHLHSGSVRLINVSGRREET